MIVASLTGAVLVFEEELKLAFDRDWHYAPSETSVEPAEVRLNELAPVAQAAAGDGERLSDVYVFNEPRRSVIFVFRDGPFDRRTITRVAVDPVSASAIEVRRGESGAEAFFRITTVIHESLFLGTPGAVVVELVTGWGVVLVVSGIMLWWPRAWRTLAGVWSIRNAGPKYRVWRDWHTVPSAYLAIPAAFVLLTGMFLSVGTGQVWTLGTLMSGGIPDTLLSPPTIDATASGPVDLDAALQAAITARPDAPLYDIGLPFSENDSVRVVAGSVAEPIGTMYVYVHPTSGEVLAADGQASLPLHGQPLALAYGIHVGGIGGITTKIIALLVCIGLIAGTITGLVMWLVRRPEGKLGAPKPVNAATARWYATGGCALGVLMPSFGISLALILVGGFVARKLSPTPQPSHGANGAPR